MHSKVHLQHLSHLFDSLWQGSTLHYQLANHCPTSLCKSSEASNRQKLATEQQPSICTINSILAIDKDRATMAKRQ